MGREQGDAGCVVRPQCRSDTQWRRKGRRGGLKCPRERSHLRKFGQVVKETSSARWPSEESPVPWNEPLSYYPSSSQLLAGNNLWEAPQISKEARLEILGLLTKGDSCWHHCLCAGIHRCFWSLFSNLNAKGSLAVLFYLCPWFCGLLYHFAVTCLTPPLAGLETWECW